ncbi:tripartite tricarboxylate transporter TctB family protein [Rhodovulum sp. PH10]|uniref:tripartite tricarboxylate transporter TctB family protein n=1 Tax=Rhodovulum sp. PH10 TaxID=1187851 RepID=UPI00058BC467|nr:tripartite tricarboxylate transporter TctB family protein [Rhodovulum sp. PH10]
MQTRPLARADLITGIVLVVFGLAALAESYGMPRLEERNINPWTIPGLVPGLLGIVIALLGLVLALRSAFAGAFGPQVPDPDDTATPQERRAARWQLATCALLCFVYAVVLVGHVPFWLATGAFVFVFIVAFEWRRDDEAKARLIKLAYAVAIAVGSAALIPYVFENLFLVRLP